MANEDGEKLYTSPEDFREKTIEALGAVSTATCWPRRSAMHGVYKTQRQASPRHPLRQGQQVAAAKLCGRRQAVRLRVPRRLEKGSLKSEVEEALRYGVVKMNV